MSACVPQGVNQADADLSSRLRLPGQNKANVMDQGAFLRAAGRGPSRPMGLALAPWRRPLDGQAGSASEAQTPARQKPAAGDDLVARALAILGAESDVLRDRSGPVRRNVR